MRQPVSCLTQSQFYSPAFNAAIFDGPIRIYFAQYQESLALKLYFQIQNRMKTVYQKLKHMNKRGGANIFIMLYPSDETYQLSFDSQSRILNHSPMVQLETLDSDLVLGISGPLTDQQLEDTFDCVEGVFTEVLSQIPQPSPVEAQL